jgi:hypothetical protein
VKLPALIPVRKLSLSISILFYHLCICFFIISLLY